MGRITQAGWLLPGFSRAVDRAGWQCAALDPDDDTGRCRWIAGFVHRRRVDGRIRVAALCRKHYELAGPEVRA